MEMDGEQRIPAEISDEPLSVVMAEKDEDIMVRVEYKKSKNESVDVVASDSMSASNFKNELPLRMEYLSTPNHQSSVPYNWGMVDGINNQKDQTAREQRESAILKRKHYTTTNGVEGKRLKMTNNSPLYKVETGSIVTNESANTSPVYNNHKTNFTNKVIFSVLPAEATTIINTVNLVRKPVLTAIQEEEKSGEEEESVEEVEEQEDAGEEEEEEEIESPDKLAARLLVQIALRVAEKIRLRFAQQAQKDD